MSLKLESEDTVCCCWWWRLSNDFNGQLAITVTQSLREPIYEVGSHLPQCVIWNPGPFLWACKHSTARAKSREGWTSSWNTGRRERKSVPKSNFPQFPMSPQANERIACGRQSRDKPQLLQAPFMDVHSLPTTYHIIPHGPASSHPISCQWGKLHADKDAYKINS